MILLMLAVLAAKEPPAREPPLKPVVVSPLTTQQLIRECEGKDADPTPSFCTGYILAAFDNLSLSRQICPSPVLSTATGAVSTTRKYLRTRAKKSTAAPAFVVRDALRRTYPCGRR